MAGRYELLDKYICRENCAKVETILENNKSLDVTYDKGAFFITTVEHNNYDIVEALLNYFEENQLEKYEPRTHKYVALKNKMRDILELAIEDVEVSEKMQKVLSGYIDFSSDDESNSSQNLGSDYEELSFDDSNHGTNNDSDESSLTEDNLAKHNKLMGDNSPGIDVY